MSVFSKRPSEFSLSGSGVGKCGCISTELLRCFCAVGKWSGPDVLRCGLLLEGGVGAAAQPQKEVHCVKDRRDLSFDLGEETCRVIPVLPSATKRKQNSPSDEARVFALGGSLKHIRALCLWAVQ